MGGARARRGRGATTLRAARLPLLLALASPRLAWGEGRAQSTVMVLKSLKEVDPLAICADGTHAGYYWEEGDKDSNLWVVYLDGGHWCYSEESCRLRCRKAGDGKCSSYDWPPVKHRSVDSRCVAGEVCGIFSPADSAELQGAHKVLVPYCTSDAFLGDGDAFGLHMRGARVVRAVMQDLAGRGLGQGANTDTLIFGGGSAGARGALVHLDHVASMFKEKDARVEVRGFLDSPLWISMEPSRGGVSSLADQSRELYAAANISHVDEDCLKRFPKAEAWRCTFGEYLLPFVQTPYLLVASQSDMFQLLWNLHEKPADSSQLEFAKDFSQRVLDVVDQVRSEKHRVLSWSCWSHDLSLSSRFSHDSVGGVTMEAALQDFLGLDGVSSESRYLVDDAASWIDHCEGFACGEGCVTQRSTGAVSVGRPWSQRKEPKNASTTLSPELEILQKRRQGSSSTGNTSNVTTSSLKERSANASSGESASAKRASAKSASAKNASERNASAKSASERSASAKSASAEKNASAGKASAARGSVENVSALAGSPAADATAPAAAEAAAPRASPVMPAALASAALPPATATAPAAPAQASSAPISLDEFRRRMWKGLESEAAGGITLRGSRRTRQAFQRVDSGQDGAVDLRELQVALQQARSPLSPEQAASGLDMLDEDGDGRLSAEEFGQLDRAAGPISAVEFRRRMLETHSSARAALDSMGPEPITQKRFVRGVQAFDAPLSPEQANYAFAGLDVDGDGSLAEGEILAVLEFGRFFPNAKELSLPTAATRRMQRPSPPPRADPPSPLMLLAGVGVSVLLLPGAYLMVRVMTPQMFNRASRPSLDSKQDAMGSLLASPAPALSSLGEVPAPLRGPAAVEATTFHFAEQE